MEAEQKEWGDSLRKIEEEALSFREGTDTMSDASARQIEELKLHQQVHVAALASAMSGRCPCAGPEIGARAAILVGFVLVGVLVWVRISAPPPAAI